MGKIILIGLIVSVLLLSGCMSGNDVHDYYKNGIVTKIDYNIIFGGTFTDWRHELIFDDGTVLWIEIDENTDLSIVQLNESGMYHFKTNFFDYDGTRYEFYTLIDVRYYDDLEI